MYEKDLFEVHEQDYEEMMKYFAQEQIDEKKGKKNA